MITLQSKLHVEGIGGMPIYDFLIHPNDHAYQRWWPGTHLEFHNLSCTPNNVGNVVYMDEYVGKHRVRMRGIVTEAQLGKKITWQFKWIIRLPVWLSVELEDDREGVVVTHTIKAGFSGIGSILDTIFRLYLSDEFTKAMDDHARIEFPRLGALLLVAQNSLQSGKLQT